MSKAPQGLVGILGWPLSHTLSPLLHTAAFRALQLDWVYLTWPVHPSDLKKAVDGLRVLGARGANVTMPHKEKVIDLLDGLSPDAEAIGAVNTINAVGGKLIGHNTDVTGFAAALEEGTGFDPVGKACLVLGAGGAARAVVRALELAGAGSITVAARSAEKAAEVALPAGGTGIDWRELENTVGGCHLIVNCTPLGMKGEDALRRIPLDPEQVVFDLIYAPPQTSLVRRARAGGGSAIGGLGMLVHQAADSLRIWTGSEAPRGVMSAAAIHALGELPIVSPRPGSVPR